VLKALEIKGCRLPHILSAMVLDLILAVEPALVTSEPAKKPALKIASRRFKGYRRQDKYLFANQEAP